MTTGDTTSELDPITLTDDEWLTALREDGPATTSELVLVTDYTQSDWDRRQVEVLKFVEATQRAAAYMRDNQDVKTLEVLVRDAALMLGCDRVAAAVMSPAGAGTVTPEDTRRYGSNIYAAMVAEPRAAAKPVAKTRRRPRPSQARKAVTGGK